MSDRRKQFREIWQGISDVLGAWKALAGVAAVVFLLWLLYPSREFGEDEEVDNVVEIIYMGPGGPIRDTMADLRLCIETEDYRRDFGHWGISPRILSWLMNHWRGELYRLGRLQMACPFCLGLYCDLQRALFHRLLA